MATQPGNGLAIFGGQGAQLPAHLAEFFQQEGTNIQPRTTVPSLSPEGKTWTISLDGQKHKMQRRNQDGDIEPLPIMKGVFLDYAKERGRAYYEGDYDPNNVSAPVCWSDDGVAPDSSLPGPFPAGTAVEPGSSRKISDKCATCPMAVKGSKVIPGTNRAATACSQHRMLAFYPDPALGLPPALMKPLRFKIAMTSDWDKESPQEEAQGWLSWSRYVDWLVARGCTHTAGIVTKMKFDTNAAFPKVFFASERPLTAEELTVIRPLLHSEDVKKLLGGTWTPAGVDGVPKDQQQVAQPQPAGEPGTADQPAPEVTAAAAPPPQVVTTPAVSDAPAGFQMNPAETFTYEQYVAGGWTDEQLITNGKLIAVQAPAPAPQVVVETPSAPPPPAAVEAAVVVGEPTSAATAATPATSTATAVSAPAAASTAATTDAVIITETAPVTQTPGIAAPAAVVVQEPAQATAPAPVVTPQAPEPTAAAAVAAEASPAVSTNVPGDVASLLDEWK